MVNDEVTHLLVSRVTGFSGLVLTGLNSLKVGRTLSVVPACVRTGMVLSEFGEPGSGK